MSVAIEESIKILLRPYTEVDETNIREFAHCAALELDLSRTQRVEFYACKKVHEYLHAALVKNEVYIGAYMLWTIYTAAVASGIASSTRKVNEFVSQLKDILADLYTVCYETESIHVYKAHKLCRFMIMFSDAVRQHNEKLQDTSFLVTKDSTADILEIIL